MPTPADSVEEFKVNVAGMGADFNSSAGAQVQIVTKRGSNQWHGTAYEYYLDNNLNANTWQNNFSGIPNPSFHYSRFGGAIGGPIIPKKILGGKTYFFANYEGFRFPQATTIEQCGSVGGDASWAVAVQRCERCRAGLQPQPDAGDLQRRHLHIRHSVLPDRAIREVSESTHWCSNCGTSTCPHRTRAAAALSRCDGLNVLGFTANMSIPQSSNFGVARLDHDFGRQVALHEQLSLLQPHECQHSAGGHWRLLPG